MAVVEFKGLGPNDRNKPGTFSYALDRMIKRGGDYAAVLDDIGRQSVKRTTDKIVENRVKPGTSRETLLRRRTRKRKPSTSGTTLLDTGIGYRMVSHRVDPDSVTVGVPDGYMAYHQLGRVPNSKRRRFLMMLTKREILRIINFHWKKAIK
jgi:phage gpG-like protein